MRTSLVITFTGSDRPGIVDALSRVVVEHQGNWERSRMARLAGRFAGILEVSVDEAKSRPLVAALEQVKGLTVLVDKNLPAPAIESGRFLRLELTGQDREGIVKEIAGALASRGVNVEDMTTECESAAMSGELVFKARAELHCPPGLDIADLRRTLERISSDLLVDIEVADK